MEDCIVHSTTYGVAFLSSFWGVSGGRGLLKASAGVVTCLVLNGYLPALGSVSLALIDIITPAITK